MNDQELTAWFSGDVKPVHHGEYETRLRAGLPSRRRIWDGREWQYDGIHCLIQWREWRGLSHPPKDAQ